MEKEKEHDEKEGGSLETIETTPQIPTHTLSLSLLP
jgi:hypothetical protein